MHTQKSLGPLLGGGLLLLLPAYKHHWGEYHVDQAALQERLEKDDASGDILMWQYKGSDATSHHFTRRLASMFFTDKHDGVYILPESQMVIDPGLRFTHGKVNGHQAFTRSEHVPDVGYRFRYAWGFGVTERIELFNPEAAESETESME